MKKGRFLWSAHRITEKQKAGKARNIKEKQLKNSRSTASRPPVAHLSSASADRLLKNAKKARKYAIFRAFLCLKFCLDCSVLMELNGNLQVYSGQITGGQAHFDLLWVKLLVDNRSK